MNRYSNKKIIGIGITSTVYKAFDKNKQEVAIKKIKIDTISNKFKSETDIIKRLNHKNILKFIEILYHKEHIYIVSELCDYPLTKIINDIIDEETIMNIMEQLSSGLKYLHNNNILHRDLKPDNILLLNNIIKIADFGYARTLEQKDMMLQTFCGTPYYMAPEMLCSSSYNSKSDLWSLGIILYQMVYKCCPFKDIDNIIELTKYYKNDPKIDFPLNEFSDNLTQLLKKLLVIDYSNRIEWQDLFEYKFYKSINNTKSINISIKEKRNEPKINMQNIIIDDYVSLSYSNKNINIINIKDSIIENYFSVEKSDDGRMELQDKYIFEQKHNKRKSFFFLIEFTKKYFGI